MKQSSIKNMDVFWVDFNRVFPNAKNTHYQKGMRMCVVISNDKNNHFCSLVNVIPLTTGKDYLPQHQELVIYGRKNYTVVEQVVTISKEFLEKKVCHLRHHEIEAVKKALKIQFNL